VASDDEVLRAFTPLDPDALQRLGLGHIVAARGSRGPGLPHPDGPRVAAARVGKLRRVVAAGLDAMARAPLPLHAASLPPPAAGPRGAGGALAHSL
jgi:hypothetical protein